jgi:type IV fimbrial biogenesis protein FimT
VVAVNSDKESLMAWMPSSPGNGARTGKRTGRTGFTLVELSVCLAVLTMLVAIGLPSFQRLMVRQQASAIMNLLTSHFASARITAITQGVPVVVCPSLGDGLCSQGSDWSSHWLAFRDPDGNRQPDEELDIYRNDPAPAQRDLKILSTSGRRFLRYQSSGFSYGTNLTIRICHDGRVAGSVIVNSTGRPRTVRGDMTTPC